MSFTVRQLIGSNKELVTVLNTDSVKKAQSLMVEHQFSQLPVVDEHNKALGLITSDSILRALNTFGVSIEVLRVLDAMDEVERTFREDDDLFALLNNLMETYAVLIVDSEHRLTGIVTSYDTTEYFRRRAEDMMYSEDIETMLRDFINAYFSEETGEIDELARDKAIAEITPSNQDLLKPFQKALAFYLELKGENPSKTISDWAEQAFTKYLYSKESPKPFDKLTLNHYIELFLHQSRWSRYSSIFSFERKKIYSLLDEARKTRNDAAHFRSEEITSAQREQLKICRDWLARHESAVLNEFQSKDTGIELKQIAASLPISYTISEVSADEVIPTEEVLSSSDSRYAPLALRLQEQPLDYSKIQLTFNQIEEIIGEELPSSARQHRSWWANDSVGHVQSQQWLEVGWRVSSINMAEEIVIFTRIKNREKAYIDFYSVLLPKLTNAAQFRVRQASPDGLNWIIIGRVPNTGSQAGFLGYSFARHGRFRTEFYIDFGDKEKNKNLYDKLFSRKDLIQVELEGVPGSLEWERIDDKRASRIALYHKGAITDSPEYLVSLSEWAVDAMIKFQRVMERHISEIL